MRNELFCIMFGGIAPTEVKLAVANLYRAMKKAGLSD